MFIVEAGVCKVLCILCCSQANEKCQRMDRFKFWFRARHCRNAQTNCNVLKVHIPNVLSQSLDGIRNFLFLLGGFICIFYLDLNEVLSKLLEYI